MKKYSKDSPISILKACDDDLPAIQQLGYELLAHERDNWESSLDPNWPFSEGGRARYLSAMHSDYVLIARISGEPVGYLIGHVDSLTDDARNIKIARLQNLYVVKEARRLGIAAKMFTGFKSYCFSQGADRIDVSVLAENEDAISFYEKIGLTTRSMNLSMKI